MKKPLLSIRFAGTPWIERIKAKHPTRRAAAEGLVLSGQSSTAREKEKEGTEGVELEGVAVTVAEREGRRHQRVRGRTPGL